MHERRRKTIYRRKYPKKNRDRVKQYRRNHLSWVRANKRKNSKRVRDQVILAYGSKCACCAELNQAFLTIDHTTGRVYKSGSKLCRWLRRNKFPKGYQLLCWNCNSSKYYCGRCPHQGPPIIKPTKWPHQRRSRAKLRKQVIDKYGGQCACCSISNIKFLTIDHINGGDKKHREQLSGGYDVSDQMYRWLRNSKFQLGYQVLCWSCNSAKYIYGQCPHTKNCSAPVAVHSELTSHHTFSI